VGLAYAGAQKNIGPAGLTLVIVREDLLGHALPSTPSAFDYKIVADNGSMYNTPPTYPWYLAGLVFQWIKRQREGDLTGLAAIEAKLASARAAYAAAQAQGSIEADRTAMARATRDLRYWSSRRATAHLVETEPDGAVRFGGSVAIEREDGRTQTWRIVGEDEADPAAGSVSHVSPLARALIGKYAGDVVEVQAPSGPREYEILEVRYV